MKDEGYDVDEIVLIVSSVALLVLLVIDLNNFIKGLTFNFGDIASVYRETFDLFTTNPILSMIIFAVTLGVAMVVIYGNVGTQETEVRR